MSGLFKYLKNFDADVSNWDTSGVTTMQQMFWVRSAPNLQPSLHCTREAVAPVCWPAPRTAPYAPLSALGRARLRSTSRWPSTRPASRTCTTCSSCAPPRALHPICSRAFSPARWTPLPPSAGPHPCPAPYAPPFDSRQYASAFNQPLSFDTSSVTTMVYMFGVRSSPCPAPKLQSTSPAPGLHRGRPPPPASFPSPPPHCMPPFRLSAGREGVQPAAELRHLQRHEHA
eukprot:scaffold60987_cov51-Phaeocystis_antarctica.AAC.1